MDFHELKREIRRLESLRYQVGTLPKGDLLFLPVSVYEGAVHVAQVEFDESWFSEFSWRIDDHWDNLSIRKTFPESWERLFIFIGDLPKKRERPMYIYVIKTRSDEALLRKRPNLEERNKILSGLKK